MNARWSIKPIDLARHAAICVRFREDSFVCSFGDAAAFHEADGRGAERYLAWLAEKQGLDAGACVHLWLDERIVGQLEMGVWKGDPTIAYVNLYYLAPEQRGQGGGAVLDAYVCDHLRRRGFSLAKLSVSASNARARRYYEKFGWCDEGPRPGNPDMRLMTKALA